MNITLIMVTSADGKTTHPSRIAWSSPEDREHFRAMKQTYPVLIMGRKTYEDIAHTLVPDPSLLRIVLTTHPETYADRTIAGQLEFTDASPVSLVKHLERRGYSSALLAGGSITNTAFLKAHLITDCSITVEPVILGTGNGIFEAATIPASLLLRDFKKLNSQGTLLLHYTVSYDR